LNAFTDSHLMTITQIILIAAAYPLTSSFAVSV
jgi:hypothetical protein